MKTFPEMNAVWDGWVIGGQYAGARHRRGHARAARNNVEIMVTAAR